jgi:hypothetical protein
VPLQIAAKMAESAAVRPEPSPEHWSTHALTFGARDTSTQERTPGQLRSLWRREDLPSSPTAQRAAWRTPWLSPHLVKPAPLALVLQTRSFWRSPGWRQVVRRVTAGGVTLGGWMTLVWMGAALLMGFRDDQLRTILFTLVTAGAVVWHAPRLLLLRGPVQRLRQLMRFDRASALPAPITSGAWQRVRGQVLDGPTFESATGKPCVVAYYIGDRAGPAVPPQEQPQGEAHATTFRLILPSREVVRVLIEHARFLTRPVAVDAPFLKGEPLAVLPLTTRTGAGARAQILHEELIAPGDHIELLGCFHRTLDRAGSAGSRTPAVETIVTGEARRPLLLRALRAESLR